MKLALDDDQTLLADTFERFFRENSSASRVRAAEPLGFDEKLWRALAEMGVFALRLPGDDGFSLFDTALVTAAAGRFLASAPIVEGILAARLLARLAPMHSLNGSLAGGRAVVVLHPLEAVPEEPSLVPGGSVADAVLFLAGDEVRCLRQATKPAVSPNQANHPLAKLRLVGAGAADAELLASGAEARTEFLRLAEEWKLLTASMLVALAREALVLAGNYAREREQFGRPIGSFQGIAHPLADRISEVEGAQMLLWSALRKVADKAPDAAAEISMAFWWAAKSSADAVERARHSFGGYGLASEYDIQLYRRRAKGLALILGDPADELLRAGRRAWLDEAAPLPEAGALSIDFGFGPEAEAFADETRDFFKSWLPRDWHEKTHHSFDGLNWELHRALGERGLLFPTWAREHGGRGADGYTAAAMQRVWDAFEVSSHAQAVSNMIGLVIARFGSDSAKARFLPEISSGRGISCLGYSEPGSGSDVFAAKTRAVRDGDEWVINGQKIFTSGANMASHVILLTRTDPTAPKHLGLTLFLVPMDSPGVEVHPVYTYIDERTNSTFYSDVRVPDAYRVGAVNGAAEVFGWLLALEQGGGGFYGPHRRTVNAAIEWAQGARRGGMRAIENPRTLERLTRAHVHARVSELIYFRSLWLSESRIPDRAAGPMSKLIASEFFLKDSLDLLDLAAPDSLLRGKDLLGEIELSSRHAAGTTVYGGTSEVQRSQIAEKALGLPRSR